MSFLRQRYLTTVLYLTALVFGMELLIRTVDIKSVEARRCYTCGDNSCFANNSGTLNTCPKSETTNQSCAILKGKGHVSVIRGCTPANIDPADVECGVMKQYENGVFDICLCYQDGCNKSKFGGASTLKTDLVGMMTMLTFLLAIITTTSYIIL